MEETEVWFLWRALGKPKSKCMKTQKLQRGGTSQVRELVILIGRGQQ
jgi:hypothetical protein